MNGQTEVCSRTKRCGEPKKVDAPIRERNAIEGAECCILKECWGVEKVLGGRHHPPQKEGHWCPCSWAEEWPVWGPSALGENQMYLLSCGQRVTEEQVVEGESLMRLSTATLK